MSSRINPTGDPPSTTPSDKRPEAMQERLVRFERALDLALKRNEDLEARIERERRDLEAVKNELRECQHTIDNLEGELLQLRSELDHAHTRLKEAQLQGERVKDTMSCYIAALEIKLAATKASPTYQLGQAIIAASKDLLAVPRRLLAVHAEGRRRDQIRKN